MNVGNPSRSLPWQGAGLTDLGRVRNSNQDAFSVENQLGLWVVADGMGGHAGGNIASDLAIQSVVEHVRQTHHSFASGHPQGGDAISLLKEAVAAGDAAIRHRVSTNPELEGMG